MGTKFSAAMMLSLVLAFAGSAAPAFAAGQFTYCKADIERLCPGAAPGGGRIVKCLKEHKDEISIGCGKELKKLKG